MEIKAQAKYIRMSPRKVRLLTNLVKGKTIEVALNQLHFADKLAALPVIKVIASAVANAKHNFDIEGNNLFIKEIRVDQAPTLDRWLPRAHGRATPLRKRMSHINVVLGEIKDSGIIKGKQSETEVPVKLGSVPVKDKGVKIKDKEEFKPVDNQEEKDKSIIDPRREGRGGHGRIEGAKKKGFTSKLFNRKAG
jgi:large subunit ribosomal protein L22